MTYHESMLTFPHRKEGSTLESAFISVMGQMQLSTLILSYRSGALAIELYSTRSVINGIHVQLYINALYTRIQRSTICSIFMAVNFCERKL